MNDDFMNLLKLLDDDNDQSATMAMAELLRKADRRLERVLRTLQETTNPRLRRRIHQLQSAIMRRRRRLLLSQKLGKPGLPLYEGIVQLHLFWFDNDTAPEVDKQWNEFVKESGTGKISSVSEIFPFMQKRISICRGPVDGATAEDVCIGTILEDGEGSDFMLCALAHLLGERRGVSSEIVSCSSFFGLREKDMVYFPARQWGPLPQDLVHPVHQWQDFELLTLVAAVLFYNAVSTDGYRYVHTLGCCLGRTPDISFLPYPYGKTNI